MIKPFNPILDVTHPLSRGLCSSWLMLENGGSYVYDHSLKSNTGTLLNDPEWVATSKGKAIKLNEVSSQYIDCGDICDLRNTQEFTISAWLRRTDSSKRLSFGDTPFTGPLWYTYGSYVTFSSPTLLYFIMRDNDTSQSYVTNTSNDWQLVSMVFDGKKTGNANRLKGYVNGKQQNLTFVGAIKNRTQNSYTTDFKIGKTSPTTDEVGLFLSAHIHNRALTSNEQMQLYLNFWAMYRNNDFVGIFQILSNKYAQQQRYGQKFGQFYLNN